MNNRHRLTENDTEINEQTARKKDRQGHYLTTNRKKSNWEAGMMEQKGLMGNWRKGLALMSFNTSTQTHGKCVPKQDGHICVIPSHLQPN